MERRSLLLTSVTLALALGLSACSNTVGDSGGGNGTTSGSPTTTGPGTTSSGGPTTTTQGDTVTLTLDSFTVPSGGEVYYCQNFANPFGGQDAQVSEFESHMSAGSHHLLLFYEEAMSGGTPNPNYLAPGSPTGPLATCSGLEFAATPYGSQTQDDSLSFPTGVAALIPGADSLRIQSHYLNTTGATVTAKVEVTFHLAAPGTVQNQAGVLFVVDLNINVPPNASKVETDDCAIPQDMNVLRASSHMHRHGTSFIATVAGNTVYQTDAWSDPAPALFNPPTVLHAGDPLHFACSFTNTGTKTLTFGESALTNEMCIFSASFYPAPTGVATIDASNCNAGP